MTDIIFETTLIKGAKGPKGDNKSYQVPTGSIIAYDGNDIPEGWIETTAPEGMGGTDSYIPISASIDLEHIRGTVE